MAGLTILSGSISPASPPAFVGIGEDELAYVGSMAMWAALLGSCCPWCCWSNGCIRSCLFGEAELAYVGSMSSAARTTVALGIARATTATAASAAASAARFAKHRFQRQNNPCNNHGEDNPTCQIHSHQSLSRLLKLIISNFFFLENQQVVTSF